MKHLRYMEKASLLEFAGEQLAATKPIYDYIILPASLDVADAVEIMLRKERMAKGVPRLVMIYIGKFKSTRILEDPKFRESFFKAIKHNIILNIDGVKVVDNPYAISFRLLHETLGSTFDTDIVEEMEEGEREIAFKF